MIKTIDNSCRSVATYRQNLSAPVTMFNLGLWPVDVTVELLCVENVWPIRGLECKCSYNVSSLYNEGLSLKLSQQCEKVQDSNNHRIIIVY